MDNRASTIVFWIVLSMAMVWAGVLFIAGIVWVRGSIQAGIPNPWHNWQEFTMPAVLLLYLPFTLLGWKRPRSASKLLFAGTAITIVQVFGSNHYNGDAMAAWFFAAIGLVGFPMLITGFLFLWRSRSHP
jgi:hypothetical protein